MRFSIRELHRGDVPTVKAVARSAFAPIYASFREVLGDRLYSLGHDGWEARQDAYLDSIVEPSPSRCFFVAVGMVGGTARVVGFVCPEIGEIEIHGRLGFNAVDPAWQRRGVGGALHRASLAWLASRGVRLVTVSTGGDASHEGARAAYERLGFRAFPVVSYHLELEEEVRDQEPVA